MNLVPLILTMATMNREMTAEDRLIVAQALREQPRARRVNAYMKMFYRHCPYTPYLALRYATLAIKWDEKEHGNG